MIDFNDKKVYLTGGSSGIGLSLGKMLAAKGAHIIIFARRQEQLDLAREEISRCAVTGGQLVRTGSLDVSSRPDVESVMSRALDEFGPPDVLINCAGRAYPHRFEDVTREQFDRTMKVNLYGAWNTASVLLPHMASGGYIVNVSSIAGLVGIFGYTDYCASKFGLIGFSEALRSELKPRGITVSVLCPPDTDTPGFEVENRTKPEETKAVSGGVKVMSADDVARALIKGLGQKRFLIVPGFDGRMTVWAKRWFPWVVEWVMDRNIRRLREKVQAEDER